MEHCGQESTEFLKRQTSNVHIQILMCHSVQFVKVIANNAIIGFYQKAISIH